MCLIARLITDLLLYNPFLYVIMIFNLLSVYAKIFSWNGIYRIKHILHIRLTRKILEHIHHLLVKLDQEESKLWSGIIACMLAKIFDIFYLYLATIYMHICINIWFLLQMFSKFFFLKTLEARKTPSTLFSPLTHNCQGAHLMALCLPAPYYS